MRFIWVHAAETTAIHGLRRNGVKSHLNRDSHYGFSRTGVHHATTSGRFSIHHCGAAVLKVAFGSSSGTFPLPPRIQKRQVSPLQQLLSTPLRPTGGSSWHNCRDTKTRFPNKKSFLPQDVRYQFDRRCQGEKVSFPE